MSQSRIAELASSVAQHTQRIDAYLAEKGLPYPSFEADAPATLDLPGDLELSRIIVLQASQELNDLLQGPRELLFNHQHNNLVYLKAISRFDLAAKVPLDGESTFAELAAAAGVDAAALTTILRFGIAQRVFQEPRPGVIAHSAASRQIAEDPRVASWVGTNVDDMWPAAERVVDALQKWPQASEPNQTGFSLANGTDDSFYTELEKSADRSRRFGGAMSFFTSGDGYSLRHLAEGYPWQTILPDGKGTVVDLGGSHGDAAFAIARRHPGVRVVVQELAQVVANSKEEPGLDVSFMVHNFFDPQPVQGADAYLFRWTLHNWPDKYCVRALRALIPALKKGAHVLVMDFVMPPPGVLPNDLERKLRAMDLTMLEIGNARERDSEGWRRLLQQADERFALQDIIQPEGSRLAILDIAWT